MYVLFRKQHYNQHDIIYSFSISEKCQDRVYIMNFVLAHKDDFLLETSPWVFFFNFSAKVMNFCHTKVPLIFLGDVSMTTFFFYLNLKIRHVMAIDDQELINILAVSCHRKSLRNCIFSLKRPLILLSICSMEPFTLILNIDYVL